MSISFGPLSSSHVNGSSDGRFLFAGTAAGSGVSLESGAAHGEFRFVGGAEGYIAFGEVVPVIPATAGGVFGIDGQAEGYMRLFGGADGGFSMDGLAYGTAGAATVNGYSDGAFLLSGFAEQEVPLSGYAFLVEEPGEVQAYGNTVFAFTRERLGVGSADTAVHTVVSRAMLVYGSAQHGRLSGDVSMSDALAFGEHASWVLHVLTEEGLAFGGEVTTDYLAVARAVETLLASGAASGYVHAVSMVLDALVLRTLADGFDYERAMDTALLATAVADAYTALGGVLDRLLTSPTATGAQRLTTLVRDDIVLDGSDGSEATFHSALRDSLGLAAHLSLDTGEYVAWVVNPQSAGVSTYRNYPFNSFASLGGRYYGATSQGLFLLEGEDDDGDAIDARIRLGLHDMNTRKLKRLPEAYIGYKSDGNLILRVIVADDQTGEKVALEYLMRPRAAPALRESRFITGRGVRAVDWDFEIENIDGADFDLAEVEFHPLIMDRRTRG